MVSIDLFLCSRGRDQEWCAAAEMGVLDAKMCSTVKWATRRMRNSDHQWWLAGRMGSGVKCGPQARWTPALKGADRRDINRSLLWCGWRAGWRAVRCSGVRS